MNNAVLLAVLSVVAFFSGSIPYGLIIAKAKGIDIRKVGSGNIGATNVMRALGTKLGLFAFFLDVLKGALPSILANVLLREKLGGLDPQAQWFIVGFFSIIGHMLSPFVGFKGGKGIATGLGASLGAAPFQGLSAFAVFIVVLAVYRYVSLASVVAIWAAVGFAASMPFFIPGQSLQILPFFLFLAGFITYKHKSNMQRLKEGTEPKFSFKKSGTVAPDAEESKPEEVVASAVVEEPATPKRRITVGDPE